MDENLSIIQEIFLLCVKLNQQKDVNTECDFHSGSNTLTVMLGTQPDMEWPEGLTRRWTVGVKNTKALKIVLEEAKALDTEIVEDDFLG
jgi:hypothetical protein